MSERPHTVTIEETIRVRKTVVFESPDDEDIEAVARQIAYQQLPVNQTESGWEIVGSEGVEVTVEDDEEDEDAE